MIKVEAPGMLVYLTVKAVLLPSASETAAIPTLEGPKIYHFARMRKHSAYVRSNKRTPSKFIFPLSSVNQEAFE